MQTKPNTYLYTPVKGYEYAYTSVHICTSNDQGLWTTSRKGIHIYICTYELMLTGDIGNETHENLRTYFL